MQYFKDQQQVIDLLKVVFPEATIYLFGSRARGDHDERSDIDLAIDAGNRIDRHEVYKAKNILSALYIPQTIDVVDFHAIPENLQQTIREEGKILWTKSE